MSKHSILLAVVIAAALFTLLTSLAQTASLTVTPSRARPGDTVTVRGTGFPPNEKVTLRATLGGQSINVGSTTSDAEGSFQMSQALPSFAPTGEVRLEAIAASGMKASATLTIVKAGASTDPAPTPTPRPAIPPASAPQTTPQPRSETAPPTTTPPDATPQSHWSLRLPFGECELSYQSAPDSDTVAGFTCRLVSQELRFTQGGRASSARTCVKNPLAKRADAPMSCIEASVDLGKVKLPALRLSK